MTLKASQFSSLILSACLAILFFGSAQAQDYPTRTIQIVVGFPPGGSLDAVGRIVADGLSKELGQTVIVENKPGASGVVAANHVATSKPDGYTLLIVPGGHALYGATFKSLPFDPVGSFEWISNVVTTPFFMTVSDKSSIKSLADVVARAKANPSTVKFGSVGPGSPHHLGVELLGLMAKVKFLHVPYRGEGPLVAALQQSEIDFSIVTPIQVLGGVQSGTLRVLAATTDIRSSRLPAVPTVEEAAGIKGFNIGSWFAVAGPAGVPAPVVERLNAAIRKMLQSPDTLKRLQPIGGEVIPSSPKEQRDRVAKELATWIRLVDAAGVEKQ